MYWSRAGGSVVPVDEWLGIAQDRYSPGVREMFCREAIGSDFRQAAQDMGRVGQIHLTHEMFRQVVEAEARHASAQQQAGTLSPSWTAADCSAILGGLKTLITGTDGVMVPLVTEAEKARRRQLRRTRGPQARRRRKRIARGADQAYKEFKIVTFYDPCKTHQHGCHETPPAKNDHEALQKSDSQVDDHRQDNGGKEPERLFDEKSEIPRRNQAAG